MANPFCESISAPLTARAARSVVTLPAVCDQTINAPAGPSATIGVANVLGCETAPETWIGLPMAVRVGETNCAQTATGAGTTGNGSGAAETNTYELPVQPITGSLLGKAPPILTGFWSISAPAPVMRRPRNWFCDE